MPSVDFADCTFCRWSGEKLRCRVCVACLPKRRKTYCSDDCRDEFWRNHDTAGSRSAVLKRDGYSCVVCGFIDWSVALREWNHRAVEVYPPLAHPEDWAIAMGLLDVHDWKGPADVWERDEDWQPRYERIRVARSKVPESIIELTNRERQMERDVARRRRTYRFHGEHQLESNHIDPRRGGSRGFGCWNHVDGQETVCRPCHVVITKLQNRARRNGQVDVVEHDVVRRERGLQLVLTS